MKIVLLAGVLVLLGTAFGGTERHFWSSYASVFGRKRVKCPKTLVNSTKSRPFGRLFDSLCRCCLSAAAAKEQADHEPDGGGDEDGLARFLAGKFFCVFDQLFRVLGR